MIAPAPKQTLGERTRGSIIKMNSISASSSAWTTLWPRSTSALQSAETTRFPPPQGPAYGLLPIAIFTMCFLGNRLSGALGPQRKAKTGERERALSDPVKAEMSINGLPGGAADAFG